MRRVDTALRAGARRGRRARALRPAAGLRDDHPRRGDPGRPRGQGLVHDAALARAARAASRRSSRPAACSSRASRRSCARATRPSSPSSTTARSRTPWRSAAASTRSPPRPRRTSEPHEPAATPTRAEVAEVLARPGERFVVTSHHNPDGDALGSMLGLARALRAAGQDVVLCHADAPEMPSDLSFLLAEGEEIRRELPDDIGERVLVAVDCATERRMWDDAGPRAGARWWSTSTTTRTTPVRRPQPGRARRLEHGRGDPRASSRRRAGRSPARWPSRSTSGWSPTPGASATPTPVPRRTGSAAAMIEAGVDAGRDVAAPLRGAAPRPPAAHRPGAGAGPVAGGRADARRGARRRRTSTPWAATTPRASSRSCAGCGASRPRPWCARPGPDGALPGLAAHGRPRRGRVGDRRARRAAAATGRRPASAPGRPPEDLLAWLERRDDRAPRRATEPVAERRRRPRPLWLVDKPAGPTSHDVVAGVRRRLGREGEGRAQRHARSLRDRACWC